MGEWHFRGMGSAHKLTILVGKTFHIVAGVFLLRGMPIRSCFDSGRVNLKPTNW